MDESEVSLSPIKSPPPYSLFTSTQFHASTPHTSFPIIAIAIIGILATGFLLVSYYVFVIKCCLNWHRIDLLRRFSFSRTRREENPSRIYSPSIVAQTRGLDEATIRSIPVLEFKKEKNHSEEDSKEKRSYECAVCLSEFQEHEKLRAIPQCGHFFHIDCIDVWLQSNANCPLCRTSISANCIGDIRNYLSQILDPSPSLQDSNPRRDDVDYVVIEIGSSPQARGSSPSTSAVVENSGEFITISPSPRKSLPKILRKREKKSNRVSSMGDECIDMNRPKDEEFVVQQPMRRSFSMDSAADSQFYLAVQEIMQRHKMENINEVSSCSNEGCSSSNNSNPHKVKRSFFSFGHGRSVSRCAAVQPVVSEP